MIEPQPTLRLPWQSFGLWVGLTTLGYIVGSDLHYQVKALALPFDGGDLELGAALVGFIFGSVSGLIIGSLQWFVLKAWKPGIRFWIPLNMIGFGLVHALNDSLPYLPLRLPLLLLVGGTITGLAQSTAFRPLLSRALGWVPLAAGAWLLSFQLGFTLQNLVSGNPLAELILGGGTAGLVTGIITGLAIKSIGTTLWYRPVLSSAAFVTFIRAGIGLFQPDFWSPDTPLDYAAVTGTSLSFLFLAIGLWGFFLHHPAPPSRIQKVWHTGIMISCISAATIGLSNFVEDALGTKELGVVWVAGILALLAGLIISGISALRVKGFPPLVGALLLGSAASILFMETVGFFGLGLALLALGQFNFSSVRSVSLAAGD